MTKSNKTNQPQPGPDLVFQPHPLARHRHFQTIYSSLVPIKGITLRRTAQEMVLEPGQGVRLRGFYSPQPPGESKGLVLLLHGWLGSAEAAYNVAIGDDLYRHGYAVFRLNLRDHGQTHHLNIEPFRGDLLDEAFAATRLIAELEPDRPFYIVGTSMGGNFALRLAWRHSQSPLPNLAQTIAICPAVNPYHTTLALDNGPLIYLAYFRRKWRKSFRQKQVAFPALYDFSEELAARNCLAMSEIFVRHHSPYPDACTYFESYAVSPAMMRVLDSPATIIAAADDSVVPVADFESFRDISPYLAIHILPNGGHVGFIDILPYRYWLSEAILKLMGDVGGGI
jgi:hypothetical protein